MADYEGLRLVKSVTAPFNATTLPVMKRNWVIGYTQTISPTMVNDIRVGRQNLATDALNYFYVNKLNDAGTQLGIPGFTGDVAYHITASASSCGSASAKGFRWGRRSVCACPSGALFRSC